jgi:hypothetical protein
MEDHPAHVTASDGGRHLDGAGGEFGVVVLGQSEARQPAGGQVLDDGQVQLALVGRDLGQVAALLLVDDRGREHPLD